MVAVMKRSLLLVAMLSALPRLAAQEAPPLAGQLPVGAPLFGQSHAVQPPLDQPPVGQSPEDMAHWTGPRMEPVSLWKGRIDYPFADPIETDRDAFTPSPKTVGKHRLIVESSYSFIDNRNSLETHSFPEALLRYGVTECVELRLGSNWEVGGARSDVSGSVASDDDFGSPGVHRTQRVSYGAKIRISEQEEYVPDSSVIVMGFTPTRGDNKDTQVVVTYVLGWLLPCNWRLDGALRYSNGREGDDGFSIYSPSVVLRVPLCDRVMVHGEYFAVASRDKADRFERHYLSPGARYLITPDLEFGVRVGFGLNNDSARCFTNAGFGWRF